MTDTIKDSAEDQMANVNKVVGSADHLTRDWEITQKSMTLLKNDSGVLPLDGNSGKRTVVLATNEYRVPTIEYALARLEKEGLLDASLVSTFNSDGLEFDDENLKKALKDADQLIILSQSADRNDLMSKAIWRVHQNEGGKAIVLSLNLPYDAATYDDADAIICAYHPYGSAHDADGNGPFNMNLAVALCTVFGQSVPQGKLPVNVPKVEIADDGTATFLDEVLYERGYGMEKWN
jgi:beta-N-acetylhexosaminidase